MFQQQGRVKPLQRQFLIVSSISAIILLVSSYFLGYKKHAPRSSTGKVAAIMCTCLGIPLIFMYIKVVGSCLARVICRLCNAMCCCCRKSQTSSKRQRHRTSEIREAEIGLDQITTVIKADHMQMRRHCKCFGHKNTEELAEELPSPGFSVWLCLTLIFGYILSGASVFSVCKGWPFLDSFFFCFAVLATIGLVQDGDIIDHSGSRSPDQANEEMASFVFLCTLYLLVGLALLSTCINLLGMSGGFNCCTMTPFGCWSFRKNSMKSIGEADNDPPSSGFDKESS